jgi:hypothetical protein
MIALHVFEGGVDWQVVDPGLGGGSACGGGSGQQEEAASGKVHGKGEWKQTGQE